MKKLTSILSILIILAVSGVAWGATYYVDCNADPGGDGTTQATTGANCAWDAIADVNGASFSGDDNVLFNKDCTWREQLTVPSSGTSGHPITFGAYGSGDKPIINGSTVMSGFETAGSGVWQIACTTEPHIVFFDGIVGTKVGSTGAVDAEYKWFWNSNVLYVYGGDDGTKDPDTYYTEVEAGSLVHPVGIYDKNYVTINGIHVTKSNNDTFVSGAVHIAGDSVGIQILNCTIDYSYMHNIFVIANPDETVSEILIQGNTLVFSGGTSIYIGNGTGDLSNVTISKNDIEYACQLQIEAAHDTDGAIKLWGDKTYLTDITVEKNYIYRTGRDSTGTAIISGPRGVGIWVDEVLSGTIVRYNKIVDSVNSNIRVERSDGTKLYGNISTGSPESGLGVADCDDVLSYNNTLYGNAQGIKSDGEAAGGWSQTGNIFKNNISTGNTINLKAVRGGENPGGAGAGNIYESNCFGAEAADFITWGAATPDTYDAFITVSSQTDNNIEADPLFTNAAGGDFTLLPGSPAIGRGQDIAGYGTKLLPGSTWPDDVRTGPCGNGCDIGAYEFPQWMID